MTCAEALRLLDAFVDNELDVRATLELEEHLAACPSCAAEEQRLRGLQEAARAHLLRHALPRGFEPRLHAALAAEPAPETPALPRSAPAAAPRLWRWVALAPVAAAAALLLVVAPHLWAPPRETSQRDAVVAAHVRSLLASHLTDVASSDQHTVKPWFQGKLDYSVTVTDWAPQGFPLVGGRLDYVEDAPAAALVYKRNQHVVNLFVWPSKRGGDEPVELLSRRGYNAFSWAKDGMRFWAVSDLNEAELRQFVELVRRRR